MLYITTKLSINYQNSIIKGILYQLIIGIYILIIKKETPEGVSFIWLTIKLEFVVKFCTVEVSFVSFSAVSCFPVEAIVCGQTNIGL